MGFRFCLIVFLLCGTSLFGQNFSILSETTGTTIFDTLDGTTELRFNVRLSGASGALNGVVAELVPPTCAQQSGRPIFNTTFSGVQGGSTSTLAVPSWSNNQTRELVFQVHMFNNNIVCGTSSSCSGGIFNFQLRLTHSSNPNPVTAGDPNNHLRISKPSAEGFQVIETVSETDQTATCRSFDGANLAEVLYNGFPSALLTDPDVRVFLGIDWNLNINNVSPTESFAFGLTNLFYPLGQGTNNTFVLKGTSDPNPSLPMLPQSTLIFNEAGQAFPLAALGGNGPLNANPDCTTSTWNFFDITNAQPLGGGAPPIINHLESTAGNPLRIKANNTQVNFRKAGIFLVREGGCNQGIAFGSPPSQIQFQKYDLRTGAADVTLRLPSSWTTSGGSQLNTNYTIEWFYRNHTTLIKATLPGGGATNSRNLTTSLAIPFTNPADFSIEARIRRVGSNAVISVKAPGHDLSYSGLANRSFDNGEFNPTNQTSQPDEYLDPGEVLVQQLGFQNVGNFASNIRVTVGRVSPTNAIFVFGSRQKTTFFGGIGDNQQVFQTNLSSSARIDLELLYELLQIGQACDDTDLFFEVRYTNQGMDTSYRQSISVPSNCEFAERAFRLDGNWTDAQNFGSPPCQGSNCTGQTINTSSPTQGWGFADPNCIGTTTSRSFFYTLSSKAAGFPVGTNSKIEMRHQATFPLLDGGGIVEFRTANTGGPWSDWRDLVRPLETNNGVNLYHPTTFTTVTSGVDNVLGNRDVFMNMTSQQNFDLPLANNTIQGDKVQFRFLYHLVDDSNPSPGLWQIADFAYKTVLAQFDDVFGLGERLGFSTCNPTIHLNPAPNGNYTFFWYTSLQNLADDQPDFTSTNGIWNFPIPSTSTDYFVKVRLDSPGTTRIYKMSISSVSTVPPIGTVILAWGTPGSAGNTDINSSGSVDIIDLVLQVNLDNCD